MARRSATPSRRQGEATLRIAVVVSRYNASITDRLLAAAVRRCAKRTGRGPVVYDAPGSFELPAIACAAAESGAFDAVVALGCVIKGETTHDAHLAGAVARGLVDVALLTGVPAAFGVLTVDSAAQASARAGGALGNKGEEAMDAALDAAVVIRSARLGRAGARSGGMIKPDKSRPGARARKRA